MKKNFIWVLILMAVLPLAPSLYAHEDKGMGMMGGEGGEGKKKMGGMMGGKMMGMSMMQKSVVATSDGGVVVVAGNKITKYDKDLNVVKEVETKMGDMEKKMKEMMEKCPMMNQGGVPGEENAPASEHESHH